MNRITRVALLLLLACAHTPVRPEPPTTYVCDLNGTGEHRGRRCWWDMCWRDSWAPASNPRMVWIVDWRGHWEVCDPSQGKVCEAEIVRAAKSCKWE